jgi:hypothetical protein
MWLIKRSDRCFVFDTQKSIDWLVAMEAPVGDVAERASDRPVSRTGAI